MSASQNNLVPKIVQRGDDDTIVREFAPAVVTRLGFTIPWDTQSTKLDCGRTVTNNDGEMVQRFVFECRAPLSELETLYIMRQVNNPVEIISADPHSGTVEFDEMKVDRIPDVNGAVTRGPGEDYDEPMYTIQLQTKSDDDENDGLDL